MTEVISAPMTGRIVEIKAKVGSAVKEEQEVIILESMKMEVPIFSTSNGRVKEISVSVGDSVKEGQGVLVIEPV